jgi:glucose-1-phosphate thymidylyltransferase
MLHANRLVLDEIRTEISGSVPEEDLELRGRVVLGPGSTIEPGATIRGPVSIGENTTIGAGTYVGPYTSIGDNCTIEDAHIESSIVVGDSTISCDRIIVDSLIGRGATIETNRKKKPNGARLVVGKNSSIVL